MNRLDDIKRDYNEIPIPKELAGRVQEAIEISTARRIEKKKVIQMQRRRAIVKSVGAAAAVVLTFTTVINTNTAFAEAVSKVPVIREISRVLTFQVSDEGNEEISIEVPTIEMIESDTNGLADSINKEIHDRCQQYVEDSLKDAKEYKKAFLATGGTEEEWKAHNLEIKVWYDVKSQSADYLSFAVGGSESWNAAHDETRYYTIDLRTEQPVTLKDLLGENYIETVNASIKSQMKTRELANDQPFWTPQQGGFTTITDETKFYINEAGNPVIVFDKYEIAPGAAGVIEFEIPVNGGVEETYADNFAVPTEAVADFAQEVKAVTAEKNLEALADLASYPLYVGFADGGVSVTSKEEFLALGEEKIFTPALLEAVSAADAATLSPSMAGFALSKGGGTNVVFGVADGRLAVCGINLK